ncbi:CRAL/TRIO domain-containing protein [Reticulomyxa filosa]|uniref:CRAL/TRIO domain-containing protein n=1 Tax=Reticulomyxa filosa TaxID=46433 RepID=X6MI15_RETFI|nr:CRAL/TRIO domain-containing protein [Reticulomyxa filosa]|eukprot:ETO13653.1 CRAL/TRIO domain-containing protein [Reticulomyxa filosa]
MDELKEQDEQEDGCLSAGEKSDSQNNCEENGEEKNNMEKEPEQKIIENLQISNDLSSNKNANLGMGTPLPEKLQLEPIENHLVVLKTDAEYIETLSQKYKEKLTTTFAHQPELVLRFVLGYNHEKPKKRMAVTCEYLEKYMETYERLKLHEIVSTPLTEDEVKVNKSWEIYIYGMDKMGHPIMYEKLGKMDLPTLQDVNSRNPTLIKLSKYRFMTKFFPFQKQHKLRYAHLQTHIRNKKAYQFEIHVMIIDMDGFSKRLITSTTRKLCKEMIGDLTRMYPFYLFCFQWNNNKKQEMAYKVFVINAPSIFKNCWKVVKTFMEPVTVDKVKVFSTTDTHQFFKELNLIADAEMIPSTFGGKGTFTIRLGDVPSELTVDLSKPYPYQLPQFSVKVDEAEKKVTKK